MSILVVIENEHTNITRIEKNGRVLYQKEKEETEVSEAPDQETVDKDLLNLEDIIAFADEVRMEDVKNTLERQVKYNILRTDRRVSKPPRYI